MSGEDDYVVRRIRWDGGPFGGRYEIIGGPDEVSAFTRLRTRWRETTWTLRGAKRAIRKRKRALAWQDTIVYREPS